jgi:hypothetical protein
VISPALIPRIPSKFLCFSTALVMWNRSALRLATKKAARLGRLR